MARYEPGAENTTPFTAKYDVGSLIALLLFFLGAVGCHDSVDMAVTDTLHREPSDGPEKRV